MRSTDLMNCCRSSVINLALRPENIEMISKLTAIDAVAAKKQASRRAVRRVDGPIARVFGPSSRIHQSGTKAAGYCCLAALPGSGDAGQPASCTGVAAGRCEQFASQI